MSDVPPEVITDIFTRLPVKSLLRFRCVSKPMCALIDSPNFVKSHLDQTLKSISHRSIILSDFDSVNKVDRVFESVQSDPHQIIMPSVREGHLYSLDFDSLDRSILLGHPSRSTRVLGSCNGLLCLYNSDPSAWNPDEGIVLWNPSTRRHLNLPISKIEFRKGCFVLSDCLVISYGFGYNHVKDDYNVVRIVHSWGSETEVNEVKVYSLKSNSWQRIKNSPYDFPYYLCDRRGLGIFVGGALHWSVTPYGAQNRDIRLIASFDLGTEKFQVVPQPEYLEKDCVMKVGELGGDLCVLCDYCSSFMDFWVMKTYGVKESWTKLFSITQPNDISNFEYVKPIAYSKSGEQVLLEQDVGKLLWYDLKLKTVNNLGKPGMPKFVEAFVCIGSLVKLSRGGSTDVTQEKGKIEKKKTQQKRDDFLSKGFKLVL